MCFGEGLYSFLLVLIIFKIYILDILDCIILFDIRTKINDHNQKKFHLKCTYDTRPLKLNSYILHYSNI